MPQSDTINCITTHSELVITAAGNEIKAWKRGKQVLSRHYITGTHLHKLLSIMISYHGNQTCINIRHYN